MMKDIIGQKIRVGDKALWMSGEGKYAGSSVYTVVKIWPNQVRLVAQARLAHNPDEKGTAVDPCNLVIITSNLRNT